MSNQSMVETKACLDEGKARNHSDLSNFRVALMQCPVPYRRLTYPPPTLEQNGLRHRNANHYPLDVAVCVLEIAVCDEQSGLRHRNANHYSLDIAVCVLEIALCVI